MLMVILSGKIQRVGNKGCSIAGSDEAVAADVSVVVVIGIVGCDVRVVVVIFIVFGDAVY